MTTMRMMPFFSSFSVNQITEHKRMPLSFTTLSIILSLLIFLSILRTRES